VQLGKEGIKVSVKVIDFEEGTHAQNLAEHLLKFFFGTGFHGFEKFVRYFIQLHNLSSG
jgi:hypothetical protein